MSELPAHPLIDAVKPVLDMLGAQIIPVEDALISDRALEWEGKIIAAVRLPRLQGALDRLIRSAELELGGPLAMLSREDKQRAIRLLDQNGAFILRRAVEDVADAMGVSRITVYNYLYALHRSPGSSGPSGHAPPLCHNWGRGNSHCHPPRRPHCRCSADRAAHRQAPAGSRRPDTDHSCGTTH